MPPMPDNIDTIISHWSSPAKARFADVRAIMHAVARRAEVGALTETLKWGQPSWLPATPRVGSTLRCDWNEGTPYRLSLFVHCQTTLAETMRTLYPDAFDYDSNRALHMTLDKPMPRDAVDHCALLTLTYHRKTA